MRVGTDVPNEVFFRRVQMLSGATATVAPCIFSRATSAELQHIFAAADEVIDDVSFHLAKTFCFGVVFIRRAGNRHWDEEHQVPSAIATDLVPGYP